ncbi:hypothetical protein LCGC14_1542540 [marine sediment metagenome]|uniref:Uncharacterized protein n=1 Tax=marine sediment metagenome TaxID=412755 RepID=A0A0F9JDL2_9ZZZZ
MNINKKMNKQRDKKIIILFGIIIFILLIFSIYLSNENKILKQENFLFKTILYADTQMSEVSIISQKGDSYYSEASFFYENSNYNSVESNCRLARGYYSDSSQKYREIKSEIQKANIEDSLINIYSEFLEVLAEIKLNMFEACEHFESASRYYDKYYDADTPYDDQSYDMGALEIDSMNEKIKLHDENVRKYNSLLGDFKAEMGERLNE